MASVTIKQDGVNSFATALWNPQHYEIFVDDRMAGLLNGYQNRWTCSVTPGRHSVYVRAYARDSNSLTRVYGYSDTLQLELLPDEDKTLSCGLLRRPPMRKYWFSPQHALRSFFMPYWDCRPVYRRGHVIYP